MKHPNEKELFLIFSESEDQYNTYLKVKQLLESEIEKEKGQENAKFYSVLRQLSDSINNAGHEKRRLDQIKLIDSEMGKICDKYEEFLP
jgi:hypothetical protein